MPVSSEICAFHSSTGSMLRKLSVHPSSATSMTCSGSGSETPPRVGLPLLAELAHLGEQRTTSSASPASRLRCTLA